VVWEGHGLRERLSRLPLLLAGYFDGHLMEFLPLVEFFDLAIKFSRARWRGWGERDRGRKSRLQEATSHLKPAKSAALWHSASSSCSSFPCVHGLDACDLIVDGEGSRGRW
jgi:hypothetical protein